MSVPWETGGFTVIILSLATSLRFFAAARVVLEPSSLESNSHSVCIGRQIVDRFAHHCCSFPISLQWPLPPLLCYAASLRMGFLHVAHAAPRFQNLAKSYSSHRFANERALRGKGAKAELKGYILPFLETIKKNFSHKPVTSKLPVELPRLPRSLRLHLQC